jgi:hypothetical protein
MAISEEHLRRAVDDVLEPAWLRRVSAGSSETVLLNLGSSGPYPPGTVGPCPAGVLDNRCDGPLDVLRVYDGADDCYRLVRPRRSRPPSTELTGCRSQPPRHARCRRARRPKNDTTVRQDSAQPRQAPDLSPDGAGGVVAGA